MGRGHTLEEHGGFHLRGELRVGVDCTFWHPPTVTSDCGTQFTSATWAGLCKCLGIEHILTTAFHPQANGMVERVHR
jgi:transposase InsO family protein